MYEICMKYVYIPFSVCCLIAPSPSPQQGNIINQFANQPEPYCHPVCKQNCMSMCHPTCCWAYCLWKGWPVINLRTELLY